MVMESADTDPECFVRVFCQSKRRWCTSGVRSETMGTIELLDKKLNGKKHLESLGSLDTRPDRRLRDYRRASVGYRVMHRLGMRPKGSAYIRQACPHPTSRNPDLAVKIKRPRGWLMLELDINPQHNLTQEQVDEVRSDVVPKLLQQLNKDFSKFELQATQEGLHVLAKLPKGESQRRSMFKKYKRKFPIDPDYSGQDLRYSGKINAYSAEEDSDAPQVIFSTIDDAEFRDTLLRSAERNHRQNVEPYYTHP